MHYQTRRTYRHNCIVNAKAILDLIIVDIPTGLLVPIVSTSTHTIPPGNKFQELFLEPMFVFVEDYLQDDGAIIVIHPHQVSTKSNILGYNVE
jgi:hypothetical protein